MDGVIRSRSGGFEFPDGTVQTSAATSCAPSIRFLTLRAPVDVAGETDPVEISATETVHWVSTQPEFNTGNIVIVFSFDVDYEWEYPLTHKVAEVPIYFKGPFSFLMRKTEPLEEKGMATFKIIEECP